MNELQELTQKYEAIMKSLDELKDLNETLIDQVTELNLLIASQRKSNQSVYATLLKQFDEAISNAVLEDVRLMDLIKKGDNQ